jgi:hypothetical protein
MLVGAHQILFRKGLAEVDDTRCQVATTPTPGLIGVAVDCLFAPQTSQFCSVSMQFSQQIWLDAGFQVKVVHILRYEKFELAQSLEFNDAVVADIGFDSIP